MYQTDLAMSSRALYLEPRKLDVDLRFIKQRYLKREKDLRYKGMLLNIFSDSWVYVPEVLLGL